METSCCPKYSSFSFVYLIKNKNYNFDSFLKSKEEKVNAQAELAKRLIQISQDPWEFWHNRRRESGGLELIPYDQIHFSPKGLNLTPDEKLIVFRFASGKYRIIGTKGNFCSTCATYYIIGFDFDYSAYDHGK
ncbi:MAG: hypothetical protein LIO74_11010 [Ruminococcus sp.]|nr:hypothetical protein [Ruminococcus sp.]